MQQICKHVANNVVAVALDVALLKCAANLSFVAFHLLHPHFVAAVVIYIYLHIYIATLLRHFERIAAKLMHVACHTPKATNFQLPQRLAAANGQHFKAKHNKRKK